MIERRSTDNGNESPSLRSIQSSRTFQRHSSILSPSLSMYNRTLHLQPGPSMDSPTDSSDEETDFDDRSSIKDNLRFGPRIIRRRYSMRHSNTSSRSKPESSMIQAPRPRTLTTTSISNSIGLNTTTSNRRNSLNKDVDPHHSSMMDDHSLDPNSRTKPEDMFGETLLHLTARLGHDEIMRLLINETSQASMLLNQKGQTPLLIAIECGSTSTAMLLMESNPRSIVLSDWNQSSVFHYACQYSNDLVLHRAIVLSKRLHSTTDRLMVKKEKEIIRSNR